MPVDELKSAVLEKTLRGRIEKPKQTPTLFKKTVCSSRTSAIDRETAVQQ